MTSAVTTRRAAGFTLLELLVVMGILTGFLLMLAQMVDHGLRMFSDGELSQAMADRASRAQRVISRELGLLRGSATGRDRDAVDDRLLVQRLPIGLPPRPEPKATRVQVLRGAVRLPVDRELQLIDTELTVGIVKATPGIGEAELEKQVAAARQGKPLRGVGNLLLLPWRQEGDDEALLELRALWLLPDMRIPTAPDREVDPFTVPVPGSPELPGIAVWRASTAVLSDLLHVEFQFWAQDTKRWGSSDGMAAGSANAETIWDSARGGWLVDEANGGEFRFDRGAASLGDPRDDIHPHAILVRCVVAMPAEFAPEGQLAAPLDADQQTLLLYNGDRFPGPTSGGFLKVRGEWIGYAERVGDELRGLRRGQRSTKALEHPAGTRVHVGRTVEFVVPIPHAKDDWNG